MADRDQKTPSAFFRNLFSAKNSSALQEPPPKASPAPPSPPPDVWEEEIIEPEDLEEPEYDLWLACKGGYMNGRYYPIVQEEAITIGRDRQNKICYPQDSAGVSENHASLYWGDGRLWLMDYGSTEGTFLDGGERLQPMFAAEIRPGSGFYIGVPENRFEIEN